MDSCGVLTAMMAISLIDSSMGQFGTECGKNPNIAIDAPKNKYYCPFENPDGTENEYTDCCYNDRPDERGKYYSCCKSEEDADAESSNNLKRLGFIIGGTAAVIFSCVFIYTYCRADTFPFVDRVKARLTYWWQWTSDHIFFCMCCEKTFKRGEKDGIEGAAQDNTVFELW